MKNYLVVLCTLTQFSVVLPSCTHTFNTDELNIDLNEAQYIVNIPDMTDSLSINYSDMYSDVNYIVLDAHNTNAIVGTICNIEITNDKDIIIFDDINHKIVRYDSCGHYLNQIGERGHGPNEYIDPRAMCYDRYNNQILVWDHGTSRVLFFDTNGTVKRSMTAPFPYSIKVIDREHLIYFYDYPRVESAYNYLIVTKDGKECSKFEHVSNAMSLSEKPSMTHVFNYTENDAILCRSAYSSIIYKYKIEGGKVLPFVKLTSQDRNWAIGNPEDISKTYDKRYNAEVTTAFVTNGKLFLDGFNYTNQYPFLYFNDLKGHVRVGQKVINDLDGYPSYTCFLYSNEEYVYQYVNPEDFRQLLDQWENRTDIPQKDRDFVSKMANSINPIIQVCTVKD